MATTPNNPVATPGRVDIASSSFIVLTESQAEGADMISEGHILVGVKVVCRVDNNTLYVDVQSVQHDKFAESETLRIPLVLDEHAREQAIGFHPAHFWENSPIGIFAWD